jgi:urease accessory protein
MTETAALQKLLTFLSPAFPVGAFAWSGGLETAIAEKAVTDSGGVENWVRGSLAHGGLRTDAILVALSHRAVAGSGDVPLPTSPTRGEVPAGVLGAREENTRSHTLPLVGRVGEGTSPDTGLPNLTDLTDLALALTPAAERHTETLATGDAFAIAARTWPSDIYDRLPNPCPYSVVVGAVAAAHNIGLDDTLIAFITAAVQTQISVAVRLVPIGQTAGLRVLAALEPAIRDLAAAAATASLDDIGGIAYAADIAQMRHETLGTRIFRS